MLYEIREYATVPGRLPDLVALFTEHVLPLFAKHEMHIVQAGTTWVGDLSFNELVYTMRFDDAADLESKWARFLEDPEWLAAAGATAEGGPMVQHIKRRLVSALPLDAATRRDG